MYRSSDSESVAEIGLIRPATREADLPALVVSDQDVMELNVRPGWYAGNAAPEQCRGPASGR